MNRIKAKGRKESGSFVRVPHAILNHENYTALSPQAKQLLWDLYAQYNGRNNGDFCCTWSMMKKRNWRSESTLSDARKELLYYGWIVCSRQGGRNIASLYGITFQAIDECKGKLDIAETTTAPGTWKTPKEISWKEWKKKDSLLRNVVQLTTPSVVKQWEKPDYTVQLLQQA